jgi:hypothetical protein
MAKKDINPDALAKKTFLMTVVGAVLYITVVFMFVIFGNRREEQQAQPPASDQPVSDLPASGVPASGVPASGVKADHP